MMRERAVDVIRGVREMQAWADATRARGETIGFVPTMGALHEGHLALARAARAESDRVVASIFVNPTQFAPGEDLEAYPRVPEQDIARLEALGTDIVFLPSEDEIYPTADRQTWITVEGLASHWCGRSRPIHFRGVATVVSKLFHVVKPHRAYFGEKDFQQLAIIRRMVREQLFDVEVVGVPTVREPDGLAMSSRNVYLEEDQRAAAPGIQAALQEARRRFAAGERDAASLIELVRRRLEALPGADVDYVGIAAPEDLSPVESGLVEEGRLLCAVRFGQARLIDNVPLSVSLETAPPALKEVGCEQRSATG